MKILTLDIETSPNLADVWGLWQQNVALSQLRETTKVICFAAKWHGEKKTLFFSDHHDGHETMIAAAWELLDEADAIITYNGKAFDVPHLNREFLLAGGSPPSPFLHIDLYRTVKSQTRFSSNKLDHVAQQLGLGQKVKHEGHELWVKCLADDNAAWGRMRTYCKHDVVLTEKVYDRLLPWIPGHPNRNLFDGEGDGCPRCAYAGPLHRRGLTHTGTASFQRFRCPSCGGWSKSGKSVDRVDLRSAA